MNRLPHSSVAMLALAFSIAASAADPSIKLLNRGLYYPASRALAFPYAACQVTNLDITVSRCYDSNLNAYDLKSYDMGRRMTKVASRHVELAPPYGEDKAVNRMLPLGELLGSCKPGVYKLEIDTGIVIRHRYSQRYTWSEKIQEECYFALTDLGVSAVVSPSRDNPQALVLVHSLKDGRPVKGAEVTLLSRNNQVVGHGRTDGHGVAKVPFAATFRMDEDSVRGVMAKKGDDMSYIQLDGDTHVASRDNSWQAELEDVRAYLFAERDICRPGESFETGLFLRSSPQGGMKAIGSAPVELKLFDASENCIERRRLATDRWGFVAAKWDIPAGAQVGNWMVEAHMAGHCLGSFSVNVAAYVPDRFRVGLEIENVAHTATNAPLVKGTAAYYFGEDVRDATWSVTVCASVAPPPAHWKGWTCGTGGLPNIPSTSDKGNVKDGAFMARISDAMFAACRKSKSPVLIEASASVTPPGARTVTALASARYAPSDRYIGVREAAAKTRDTLAFELAWLPAKAGAPLAGADAAEIAVKLIRNEWKCHTVEQRNGMYRLEWREEHTELPDLARDVTAGTLEYQSRSLAAGSYTLVATSADGLETRLHFWHWEGDVSERSASPAALYLKSDSEKVQPGGAAKLTFNASRPGRAYFAAGERGIETTGSFAVKPGVNSFTVPVRKDAASRFTYVAVTVLNENSPNVRRLSGLARIRVDHADRRYPVSVEVPEVVRPGGTLNVKVKADGGGAVRLMAVDEGVLALTGYMPSDIFAFLYDNDFGCPLSLHDLYSQVYPDLKLLPNGQIGGGGAMGIMKRKNVRTRRDSTLKQRETARVVLPLVEIPAYGETTVQMTMPDFTGAMRVMAVAVDERRAGAAQGTVIVRDAASLFLNAPRFAVGGDSYELTAEVFNHDLPESDWSLDVLGRSFKGRLGKGRSTNVTFRVQIPADASGVQDVRGTLKMGGETFRDSLPVTVRPKNPPVVEMAYSVRRADAPKPQADSSADAWVRLDEDRTEECAAPKAAIAGALKWLEDYPYGCLEQTAAAAFPFLAADDLLRLGVIDAATRSNAVTKVKAAYGEIMQMALGDGSFSMWPGGGDTWMDGSLFAIHFIFAAERQGWIAPSQRDRGRMVAWLRRISNVNSPKTRLNRAYAAYILALGGEKSFANAAKNILATKEIDFASLLASVALLHGGYAAEGVLAYEAALAARVWEKGELPVSSGWSRIRAYGMALSIIGASPSAAGNAASPLAVKLIEALRGDGSAWGTTRDNAWACYGLSRFAQRDLMFSCRVRAGIPKEMPARSDVIKVSRPFPSKVKKGELVEIEISVESPQEIERAVLCDLVPGGFELEDSSLVTRAKSKGGEASAGRREIRDDRLLWFGCIRRTGKGDTPLKIRYMLRAVTRGTFAVPALSVEDMYDPDVAGVVDLDSTVTVE